MITTVLLASALVVQAAPQQPTNSANTDYIEVGFSELSEGQTQLAIAQIQATLAKEPNDPSALINLGTAYARVGQIAKARTLYRAAIASSDRYDLQLASGSWIDSRRAARIATKQLGEGRVLALR